MKKTKSKFFFSHEPGIIFWIILIFASLFPLSLTRFGIPPYLTPQIELPIIFFAAIYLRISPLHVFLYGLLLDVAYGKPMGITSMLILLLFHIVGKMKTKLENLSIRSIILHFTYTIIIVKFVEMVLLSIYYSSNIMPHIGHVTANIVVNVVFYIILHYLLQNKIYSSHENK